MDDRPLECYDLIGYPKCDWFLIAVVSQLAILEVLFHLAWAATAFAIVKAICMAR